MAYQLAALSPIAGLEPLLAQVESLPLHQRRQFLATRVARQSDYIFKYRPLFEDGNGQITGESREFLRQILVDNVLWLASPDTFNDPFDMAAKITTAATLDARRTKFQRLANLQGANLSARAKADVVARLAVMTTAEIAGLMQASVSEFRRSVGVCCLAGNPANLLMWSHYANGHQGVCLVFDRLADYRTLSRAVTVDYDDPLPELNWFHDFHESLGKLLLRKSRLWKYEGENRVILENQARKHLQFRPEALKAIVLGARTTRAGMTAVSELMLERRKSGLAEVSLYRSILSSWRYAVTIRRYRA